MIELIDSRNENLWKRLNENYNISFLETDSIEYGCYSKNNDVVFHISSNNRCKDSFTHEMLHIYLRLNGSSIASGFKKTINESKILSYAMSEGLLEHIGNCLDHIKMLPMYLDMGFDRTKFIIDFAENKCIPSEINFLRKHYKIGKSINAKAFDIYFGKLLAILADPNPKIDYSKQIAELKKIDLLLFQIINEMVKHWQQIKIDNREVFDDNFNTVLVKFYENMKKWISKNKLA